LPAGSALFSTAHIQARPCANPDRLPRFSACSFGLELPAAAKLRHAQAGKFLFPAVERHLAHSHLAGNLLDRNTLFGRP
jgi:hypothetical protein